MEESNDGEINNSFSDQGILHTNEYDDLAREWLNMCTLAIASISATTSVWLQLTTAGIALHTSQLQSTPASRANARKASLISVLEDGYKTMAASIDKLSMALSAIGEKVAGSKFDVHQNCQVYEALASLGLDENYRVRCYCYLCSNPSKAALLVAAPTDIRGKLLGDIMKAAGDPQ